MKIIFYKILLFNNNNLILKLRRKYEEHILYHNTYLLS